VAVVGYAILVVGFGLDFRPLHHDEAVTLHVAGQPSFGDVFHVAVWDRHGPPLHYLIVHATLDWRYDILGLRLPSAVFGILAVGLAFGCGRELLGRGGGAAVAVVTAVTPITIHLAQFARGYTAMIACAYGSLWLLLILVRTGRLICSCRRAIVGLATWVKGALVAACAPSATVCIVSSQRARLRSTSTKYPSSVSRSKILRAVRR
jgi:predicted membrane-bound mannosyltransferase